MLLKLESDFFTNRNRLLNFERLRKTGQLGAWIELGRLVYFDVISGTRRLTFDVTYKNVTVAKFLRRKMSQTSSERYRRRWQFVCASGFNGGSGRY